jgi:hypothetical protein
MILYDRDLKSYLPRFPASSSNACLIRYSTFSACLVGIIHTAPFSLSAKAAFLPTIKTIPLLRGRSPSFNCKHTHSSVNKTFPLRSKPHLHNHIYISVQLQTPSRCKSSLRPVSSLSTDGDVMSPPRPCFNAASANICHSHWQDHHS